MLVGNLLAKPGGWEKVLSSPSVETKRGPVSSEAAMRIWTWKRSVV